jgi:hypothetical protein
MTPQPHSGLDRDCLRCLLSRDHARLDALFEQLTAAFDGHGSSDLPQLWRVFESGLMAHLALEERDILPEMSPTRGSTEAIIDPKPLRTPPRDWNSNMSTLGSRAWRERAQQRLNTRLLA